MELSEDFIKDNGLTAEQAQAIGGFYKNDVIPNLKKEWDGVANKNAEGILAGAAKYAAQAAGVTVERGQGEKYGDYLQRIADAKLNKAQADLQAKQQQLDEKLKNFKGGEEYQQQINTLAKEKDDLLKKVADLEPLMGMDEKYNTAQQQLTGLKLQVAYGKVKPNFPETVNPYEAQAKWDQFIGGIEEKYTIELVDGSPVAIDKENKHKTVELGKLVKEDENLKALLENKKPGGSGAKPTDMVDVAGVPFKVPKDATSVERSKLIREYLAGQGISLTDPVYAKKFQELNKKILTPAPAE